ncbi:MAG: hypothetical protein WC011_04055 [Candidatus Paceibacterota bacterium]
MQQQMFKHVTNRQGVQLVEYAREFGLSRQEFLDFLNNKEKLENFMRSLQSNQVWFDNLQKSVEKIGARLHLIENLVVDYSIPHNQAAMSGGPQTGSDYNVLKVTDLYQSEKKVVTETIVLLNYPKGGGNYSNTVAWGMKNGLVKTTPHVPFAIGENFPKLNYDLGSNPMYVVETTGCTFGSRASACGVWWGDAERKSSLNWQSGFGNGIDWFAFRK